MVGLSATDAVDSEARRDRQSIIDFTESPEIESDDWDSLIPADGLDGWIGRNGTATFVLDRGEIVGRTAIGSPKSFLCTKREFSDFELTFEVRLDDRLNSGLQIRSSSHKHIDNGRVRGPQVEIEVPTTDKTNPCEAGYVYSEGTGRGWISQHRVIRDAVARDDWNRFVIRAAGPRIQTWINGRKIEDLYNESMPRDGFIAFQVHCAPEDTGPLEVRFRDIRVRELPIAQ